MKKLLIATRNPGKVKEIKEILKDLPFNLVDLNDISCGVEVEETGKTFKENAVLKAKEYALKTGLLALADDSGLEIDALGGKPGVYSARMFSGKSAKEMSQGVLEMMEGVPKEKRSARFKITVAIADPSGKIKTAEGISEGEIALSAKGENGFGFDPVFIPEGLDKTNAELGPEEKHKISHRGKALKQVKELLKDYKNVRH